MNKRILLTSVSAGAGHKRAAEALEKAFIKAYPGIDVRHIDMMDYVSPAFKEIYINGYLSMINQSPRLWGYLYSVSDKMEIRTKTARFINKIQRAGASGFFKYLDKYAPDIIVSTHFITGNILLKPAEKGRIKIPLDVIVTDYDLHQTWLSPIVRRYYAARELIAYKLKKHGVPPENIKVTGIPIDPVFSEKADITNVYKMLGFTKEEPVLLISSGAFGISPIEEVIIRLGEINRRLQVISVSGNNRDLKIRIDGIKLPAGVKLKSLGFVNNMHELYSVADAVITKPGGLTTSECLAKGVPMFIISPIPGQEELNADYVLESGAGVKVLSSDDLVYKLSAALNAPGALKKMRENAKALGRPDAARDIARDIAGKLLQQPTV